MTEPTPFSGMVVGEEFWLIKGREMVEAAVTKREVAAERILAALAWFWTVYSAAALLGVAVAKPQSTSVTALLAMPIILLVVAYAVATSVTLPVRVTFDPRIPVQIESEFLAAADEKKKRLLLAQGLMILSALCIAAGVVVSLSLPSRPVGEEFSLVARSAPRSSGTTVVVSGNMSPGSNVLVTVTVKSSEKPTAAAQKLVTIPKSGRLNVALTLSKARGYQVSANWIKSGLTQILTREVSGAR
ncbi:hypothetical protein [Streptomyces sp. NPDC017991]|uniref:hypothetical protein n=1 Tax=Streptomyces sp. NPDC017991 TaxID=3365026 RepID=UPI00378C8A19